VCVNAHVDITVEVVGCYIRENEQPAVNIIDELMQKKNRMAACVPGARPSPPLYFPLLLHSPRQSRHLPSLGLHDVQPHGAG
jgi:hypothetical protein